MSTNSLFSASDAVLIAKNGDRLNDQSTVLALEEALIALSHGAAGIWVRLEPAEDVRRLKPFMAQILGLEVHFPAFRDGRGYSTARIIRDDLGFKGPLRAVGDVMRDQVFVMLRAGFDQFLLKDPHPEAAIEAAKARFSTLYQHASDDQAAAWRVRGQIRDKIRGVQ